MEMRAIEVRKTFFLWLDTCLITRSSATADSTPPTKERLATRSEAGRVLKGNGNKTTTAAPVKIWKPTPFHWTPELTSRLLGLVEFETGNNWQVIAKGVSVNVTPYQTLRKYWRLSQIYRRLSSTLLLPASHSPLFEQLAPSSRSSRRRQCWYVTLKTS